MNDVEKRIKKAVNTISLSHNFNEKGFVFLMETGKLLLSVKNPDSFQLEAIDFYNKYVIEDSKW